MDYLRRLLLRSLAVPREQGSPVFDPFAQVAGWEFDATVPPPQESAAGAGGCHVVPARGAAARTGSAPHAAGASASIRRAGTRCGWSHRSTHGLPGIAAIACHSGAARARRQRRSARTRARAADASRCLHALPRHEVGGRARGACDAPRPCHAQRDCATADSNIGAGAAHERDRRAGACAARGSHRRASIRAFPRARVASPIRQRLPRLPQRQRHRKAHRRSQRRPERIVQTTVVVAAAARGLDDLAHSSGISRFGLGQS